jgi:hypothetical protein
MKRLQRWLGTLAMVAVLAFLLAGRHNWSDQPPAAKLLPELPAYRQLEGQTLSAYLGSLAEGAALLAGQPAAALKIAAVDRTVACYQETGAVRVRLYSKRDAPLLAGAVAVVDADAMTDPATLIACAATEALAQDPAQDDPDRPCAGFYTLDQAGSTFHIAYAGTSAGVCLDLCTALEGCGRTAAEPPAGP